MKPSISNRFRFAAVLPLISFISLANPARGADRWWDAGTVNIGTNGDGISTFATGTWNTTTTNWDQGAVLAHVAWNNANLDNAIFSGTGTWGPGTGNTGTVRNITVATAVTVNQLKILWQGAGLNDRYDLIGTGSITFGGSYSASSPALDLSGGTNNTITTKMTGTITGGLVIAHGANITSPGTAGRLYINNTANDFIGDITVLSGNLHVQSDGNPTATPTALATSLGNSANKVILKGGAMFASNGGAVTQTFGRNIEVASASGISNNAATGGLQVMAFTGSFSGAGDLTRYASITGAASSEVRLSGSMAAYTGTIDNRAGILTIQTTDTSGGAWKLTGGTLKLNTTDNTHIANGAGKSDLLMTGGTLDMNGKSETINGLSGATGIVQNALASTTSTLTLGDADTTATYGGSIRNNAGTGGTVAVTKTGAGTQALTGNLTYTGATTVNAGTLTLTTTAATLSSAVTVAPSATLGLKLSAFGGNTALSSLATGAGAGSTLELDSAGLGLSSGTPPLTCTGSFTPGAGTGNTRIKLKGYDFSIGVFPLIKYTTLDGSGFAGLDKILPYRMVATLVNNTTDPLNTTIDLDITSAETAVWKGEVGGTANGNWDVDPDGAGASGTLNWKTSVAGTATRYAQGSVNTDQVTFDDNLSATGTSTVNLTSTLTPRHVRVDNGVDNTYTFTGTGKLSGETSLEKVNYGTLILSNTTPYDYSGGTTIADGTLRLGDGTTAGAGRIGGSITNSGTLAFHYPEAVTVTNPISGFGSVLKLGSNTLTMNATNLYGGGTTLSTGTVAASTAASLGGGPVTLGDAATGGDAVELTLNNRVDLANAINVSTNGTGTAILSASNTGTGTADPAKFTGIITLDRATTFRSDIVGDILSFTGRITSTPPELPETALAPVILTISGGQTVSLESTANDFTGDIRVTGAGTSLQAKVATGSEVIPDSVNVDLAAGTFLKLAVAGSTVETIARLTGTGTVERPITGTQTLAVGTGGVSSVFDGVIRNGTGTVALRKNDSGTFTLTNTNTYTGSTAVFGGTLLVNGSITSASIVSGGTLGGTGTVAAMTVSGSGKVSPATVSTIGTLAATGNVSFVSGTEFTAQINSGGTPGCDRLDVTGTLALGNATLATSDLGSTVLTAATRLVLATATGAISGTFNGIANNGDVVIGSNTFKIKYDDTEAGKNAVTLNKAAAAGYSFWATTNGVGAADADHDNDGVKNGVEYVLGTDPKVAGAGGIVPTTTATEFKFTFTRSDASETLDTAVLIETSNDLVHWNADASPYSVGATTGTSSSGVTIVENPAAPAADPGTDTVTLTVLRNTTAKFARLKVVVTP